MARPRKKYEQEPGAPIRVPMPRGKQVIGIVEERMGYGKSRVRCTDGHLRLCRIPGARRRDLWIRPGKVVLIEPWVVQSDERADIVYQYSKAQVGVLKKKGLIKDIEEEF
jgi:translation initiation factor 1A